MTTKTFYISAISCNHCIHTIVTELKTIAGVKAVEGDADTKKVTVQFEAPATLDIIRDLLTSIQYEPDRITD
jgi:copper chaperone CopZ